jgi:shikimate kinase
VQYFNEKIKGSKDLSKSYQLKFSIASDAEGYLLSSHLPETNEKAQTDFLKNVSSVIHTSKKDFTSPEDIILMNRYTNKPIKLTTQQARCLRLLAVGNTNKQIAKLLNLSTRTVENYFDRIRTLLDCHTSKELIVLYHSQKQTPYLILNEGDT